MIALVPFECPKCQRAYRVELDFVKMRRLNRVAVCRGCEGRYSLSVRLEKSSGPVEPDPYAKERRRKPRRKARAKDDNKKTRPNKRPRNKTEPDPKRPKPPEPDTKGSKPKRSKAKGSKPKRPKPNRPEANRPDANRPDSKSMAQSPLTPTGTRLVETEPPASSKPPRRQVRTIPDPTKPWLKPSASPSRVTQESTSWPPILSAPPPLSDPPPDMIDPLLDEPPISDPGPKSDPASDSEPPEAVNPDPYEVFDTDPPEGPARHDTEPNMRRVRSNEGDEDDEDDDEYDDDEYDDDEYDDDEYDDDEYEDDESVPLSQRRPQRRGSGPHRVTLDGVGPKSSPPSDEGPVSTHVIVEVGVLGEPKGRRTTKSYRPEHLVTIPGMPAVSGKSPKR